MYEPIRSLVVWSALVLSIAACKKYNNVQLAEQDSDAGQQTIGAGGGAVEASSQCAEADCPDGSECSGLLCSQTNPSNTNCGWHLPGKDADAELCEVPEGVFTMGCDESESGCPTQAQPAVTYRLTMPVYFDRFEVSNRRYQRLLEESTFQAPACDGEESLWNENRRLLDDHLLDHPVVCASSLEAESFCEWGGKTLPTEAQWEAAARSNDRRDFPWGDTFNTDRAQCFHDWEGGAYDSTKHCADSYDSDTCLDPDDRTPFCHTTAPVVWGPEPTLVGGSSPFGLTHLAGNVAEWTLDGWVPNHQACVPGGCGNDPTTSWSEGENRAVRGGSFKSLKSEITTWSREERAAHLPHNDVGFRCAFSPPN